MDFERMNDAIIAERILNIRKSLNFTQEEFCERFEEKVSIDKFRLSALENGKRSKKKNPHFLTEAYIEFFATLSKVAENDFVFGNIDERKNLIKLIILNIFMNADSRPYNKSLPQEEQTPIVDLNMDSNVEFFRLAMLNLEYGNKNQKLASYYYLSLAKENTLDKDDIKKVRHAIGNDLKNIDSFFFSDKIGNLYRLSMNGMNDFDEPSSILLKCLFGNFKFANDFLNRRDNTENISVAQELSLRFPPEDIFYIDNYLDNKGNFSTSAIHWKETGFKYFITAFNEFITLHMEDFLDFFNKNIFCKSLKQLSNSYINQVFSSEEFIKFLNNIYLKDQFIIERMVGHNFARVVIQEFSLIKNNSLRLKRPRKGYPSSDSIEDFYNLEYVTKEEGYGLNKYLYDFKNMTTLFGNGEQIYKEAGLFLPSYFHIVNLK